MQNGSTRTAEQRNSPSRQGERDRAEDGATATPTPEPRPSHADWDAWLAERQATFDNAMRLHFETHFSTGSPHSRLADAVRYSMNLPGKRMRPLLVLECCQVCGGDDASAMPAAMAIECVHTFSLVHDDLPAMDDDDLRRGQPTNHRVFGEALAILAGDWLATHSFNLLATAPVSPAARSAMCAALASATESMVIGQAADIESEALAPDAARVEFIHLHKTARLIEASCRLGAIAADATDHDIAALGEYGRRLGIAFQISDDLLDKTGSTQALGKRAGKDEHAQKQTFPAAFGIDESRRRAEAEIAAAIQSVERFGLRADRLRSLARFVVSRER